MNTTIIISIIGLIISFVSVSAAIYFSQKNNKTADVKNIEQRIAERTEMNMKLDEINRNTTDIKYDISVIKKDVQKHGERLTKVEESLKSAWHKIDEFKKIN